MPLTDEDRRLIWDFMEATRGLSPERAAEAAGLNGMTVRRWKENLPSRLTTDNRERILAYLASINVVSRGTVAEAAAEYVTDFGGPVPGPNRAYGWIARAEHTAALKRGEGVLHYGDVAADARVEAREKKWTNEECLTIIDWMATKLRESERARVTLQRAARERAGQRGTTDSASPGDSGASQ